MRNEFDILFKQFKNPFYPFPSGIYAKEFAYFSREMQIMALFFSLKQ